MHHHKKEAEKNNVGHHNPRVRHPKGVKKRVPTTKEEKQSHDYAPSLMHGKARSHHDMMDVRLVGPENRLVPIQPEQSHPDPDKDRNSWLCA